MLEEKIKSIENQMLEKLKEIRTTYDHSGNKGSNVEKILRDFLGKYLPRRLDLAHGEVIDRQLNKSAQADIVIVNEEHPFTFSKDSPGLFFIEGVSAVGEVKSVLTSDELKSTFEKARKYKKLQLIIPKGAMVVTNDSDGCRYYTRPPFFLFAFESQITIEKVFEVVKSQTSEDEPPGSSIDGIFILGRGFIIDLGDGKESFRILNPTNKIPYEGWLPQISEKVLFNFLAWLSVVMPRMVGGLSIIAPYLINISK